MAPQDELRLLRGENKELREKLAQALELAAQLSENQRHSPLSVKCKPITTSVISECSVVMSEVVRFAHL